MLNLDKIHERVEQGYISVRPHPSDSLRIFNYTSKTQIEAKWDDVTMACRGLILDHRNNVVARPFQKFFNVGEIAVIRNRTSSLYGVKWKDFYSRLHTEPFKAYPKMDGSLGVVYLNPCNGFWEVATRGSFESPQAQKANTLLKNYTKSILRAGYTYLVEIIYPENRIVVDYKGREELLLLAAIRNKDGQDDWEELERINKYWFTAIEPVEDLSYLSQLEAVEEKENEEGYVLVYPGLNNFRMKFKFSEYCRLHRIMTDVTPKRVWEQLRNNVDLSTWLDKVPDEFYTYVEGIANGLLAEYLRIDNEAKKKYREVMGFSTRKGQAQVLANYPYRSLVFAMLDGKDYSENIWRLIEPKENNEKTNQT